MTNRGGSAEPPPFCELWSKGQRTLRQTLTPMRAALKLHSCEPQISPNPQKGSRGVNRPFNQEATIKTHILRHTET